MSKPLDLETQRPYALDQLTQLQSQIMQSAQGMVVQRARIEKYRQSDLAAARDTYTELEQIRRNLTEQITAAQLFLLELEEYKLASMAGQLCRGISGFNLMSTGYKPIYEVLSKFAAAFPTGQKTNAAVVGRLMNNIKLGYYPTDPDNISLMLRAIRFPDGVTTNLFDPCCGCGKALRQLAQGNNCYPDQPYGQPEVIHPIDGSTIMEPQNCGDFSRLLPKEEKVLELVQQKVADGGRVLIYTSWTRTDSQKKLIKLLRENGYCTELLTPRVPTEKREEWVDKQVKKGLQVLIANPRCLETGLDLNAFATVIYYSMSYNLFTLRQASRRSWRINQTATKVEVYMLYYANTMQAKTMKLMASKLAVAGIIEGTFSEEGLAAMSDVRDMTSQMAKELAAGIRDNVEDIAAAFKKMAIINPNRKKSVQEETDVEGLPALEIVPEPHESSVRTAQAAAIWERYEGLLARTNEEKKKRKSKVAEADENQLSIFDFAA